MAAAQENRKEAGATGDSSDPSNHKTELLLRSFIIQSVRNEDPNICLEPRDFCSISENDGQDIKQVVGHLIQIADELNKNVELKRLIESIPVDSTQDVFLRVYKAIFADGFSWGKVAVVLHFASKLVLKAALQKCKQLISSIFSTTLTFLESYVTPWVHEQGGWESLTWQNVAVAAGFAVTAACAFLKY